MMDYEFLVDPSSLVIESELLALEIKLENRQKQLKEQGHTEDILVKIPDHFLEFVFNSDEPIEESPYARFFANEDDRLSSREQIKAFLKDLRWDNESGETEDKPFENQGYHPKIAELLDGLLGHIEDTERSSWLIAARRKTLDAFSRANRTIIHQSKKTSERIVADVLEMTEEEREHEILTQANVARALGKYAVIAGTVAGVAYISASTFPPGAVAASAAGKTVADRVLVAIDP